MKYDGEAVLLLGLKGPFHMLDMFLAVLQPKCDREVTVLMTHLTENKCPETQVGN